MRLIYIYPRVSGPEKIGVECVTCEKESVKLKSALDIERKKRFGKIVSRGQR